MSDLPAAQDDRPAHCGALAALACNLLAGARLACGRELDAQAFRATFGQALCILALAWCVAIAAERLAAGSDASFWVWGFIAEAARIHLWLAVLALSAWLCGAEVGLAFLIVVSCSASLPIWVLCTAVEQLGNRFVPDLDTPYTTLFYGSALLWYCTLLWRALALSPTVATWRRVLSVAAYGALLGAMHQWLPDSPLFYQAQSDEPGIDVESVYYRQAELVDTALASLRPQTPGVTDLYFVGMAAYAAQDVFMREALQVRDIVIRRLGLDGHTLTMINNRQTLAAFPLANRHNLARVTLGLGRVMDISDDVAVLFLTSHGYEDSSLAVEFGALGLNNIYAEDIRASLDAAGIRYRVIIVSACYSGGFIDGLKSADSIVITAAARDRSSFGCSSERDWTYFGEAYFAEALLHTTDFVAAFKEAATTIERRERRELKEASNPQISVGENIGRHLRDWRPATSAAAQPKESR